MTRWRRYWLLLALCLLPVALVAAPGARRQAELIELLYQDCGACHGLYLHGGLGPALTAQALANRPPMELYQVIAHGRSGTAMPRWQGILTDSEIRWLVDHLKLGDVSSPEDG